MLDALDVCARLRAACAEAGSQTAWAEKAGVSLGYVNDVLQARREPGDAILRALGLRRVVRYVKSRKSAQ